MGFEKFFGKNLAKFFKNSLNCNLLFNFWDFPWFIDLLPVMTVVMTVSMTVVMTVSMTVVMTVVIVMTFSWRSRYDCCSHSHDF